MNTTMNTTKLNDMQFQALARAMFSRGADNDHEYLMDVLHECASDAFDDVYDNNCGDFTVENHAALDLPDSWDIEDDQRDELIQRFKDGFWSACTAYQVLTDMVRWLNGEGKGVKELMPPELLAAAMGAIEPIQTATTEG